MVKFIVIILNYPQLLGHCLRFTIRKVHKGFSRFLNPKRDKSNQTESSTHSVENGLVHGTCRTIIQIRGPFSPSSLYVSCARGPFHFACMEGP